MRTKPTIIIYKESLAQSIISDVATFGLILLCIWSSQGSIFWTFLTGCIFLFFAVVRAAIFTNSHSHLRFYSLAEVREWLEKEESKA